MISVVRWESANHDQNKQRQLMDVREVELSRAAFGRRDLGFAVRAELSVSRARTDSSGVGGAEAENAEEIEKTSLSHAEAMLQSGTASNGISDVGRKKYISGDMRSCLGG